MWFNIELVKVRMDGMKRAGIKNARCGWANVILYKRPKVHLWDLRKTFHS